MVWGRFSCHYIMHNGEINTIRGNADRMLAREETMHSALLSDEDMDKVLPVVDQSGSDSAMLDNTLEFLMMNGIDLPPGGFIRGAPAAVQLFQAAFCPGDQPAH